MSFSVTMLIGMPWLLSGLALGLDRYLKTFPARCDDLWRLPRPSSLR